MQVLAFIKEWKEQQPSVSGVAKALVEHCIENLSSTDNISIVIVFVHEMKADAWTVSC